MANHLEELMREWYEYRGYLVRVNDRVGRRTKGGHEGELDIVAFHPAKKHLVHIETSTDAGSWSEREKKLKRKFATGDRHIRSLFQGLDLPDKIEKIALFALGDTKSRGGLCGAKILSIGDVLCEIFASIRTQRFASNAIPEKYSILRTLQQVARYKKPVFDLLSMPKPRKQKKL
jgi:hypothetical protein